MADKTPEGLPSGHGIVQGVSVDHPSIVNACRNIARNGGSVEQAMEITGMPAEVVQRHMRAAKRDD